MSKKVVIKLGKDGSINVEAQGFKGSSCEDATKFLDQIFDEPTSRKPKSSYYEDEVTVSDGLPSGWCG